MFGAEYNIASWAVRSLFWMAPLLAVGVLNASAVGRETRHQQVREFRCDPSELYRGDTLTITFLSTHDRSDLSIVDADVHNLRVSFQRRAEDKYGPFVPPELLRRAKRVKLSTLTAQGLPVTYTQGEIPPIVNPPRRIFTKEGNYDVLVGENLLINESEVAVCHAYYYDYPRSRRKRELKKSENGQTTR